MSLSSMINNIKRLVPGLHPDVIKSTIQQSYQALCSRDWAKLLIHQRLTTVAPYSTGTVAVSTGGVVTPTGGTFAATMVGSYMRVYYDDPFFEIETYTSPAGTLTLKNWTGVSVAAGTSYSIFKPVYTLDTAFGQLFKVSYQIPLQKKSQAFFNKIDPGRLTTGDSPYYWAFAGVSPTTNALKIELYPVPSSVISLGLDGKQAYATLTDASVLLLPENLIEAHATVDCFRMKESLSPKEGWEQRVTAQLAIYNDLLETFEEDDYQIGNTHEKVKDMMFGGGLPTDDNFALSHDMD